MAATSSSGTSAANTNKSLLGTAFTGMGAIGGIASALNTWYGAKNEAKTMNYNASLTRKEAKHNWNSAITNELTNRKNANIALSQARAIQGASGFTNHASGGDTENTLAKQLEYNIAKEATIRDNQLKTAQHQANILDWQARQTKKAGQRAMFGGIFNTVLQTGLSLATPGITPTPK